MEQPISATVINWEKEKDLYGVWVQYPNGRHHAYKVGSKAYADAEAQQVMHSTTRQLTIPLMELVARRQESLANEKPDYHVYAGELLVGRIYKGEIADWLWSLNGVFASQGVGARLHGNAGNFDEARDNLGAAFNQCLAWVLSVLSDHKSAHVIEAQLKRIGVG